MSSGLDCSIEEATPGSWYIYMEKWDLREEYDTYGPFRSLDVAKGFLGRNLPNPGGYSVCEYGEQ